MNNRIKKFLFAISAIAIPVCFFTFAAVAPNLFYLHQQNRGALSNQEHLNQFAASGNVILDFYADWCNPCKRFSPIFDAIAAQMPQFTFIKINRDSFRDLAQLYNITSIPTLIFLRDGKEIGRYDGGPLTEKTFQKLIHRIYN